MRYKKKNATIDYFILFYVDWKLKGLATLYGHSLCLTAAAIGGKLVNFQISSSVRGGKPESAALPLLQPAVNLQFPVFLLSERRKTGNCSYTACTYGGKLKNRFFSLFFPSFALLWVTGRGLVQRMMEAHV